MAVRRHNAVCGAGGAIAAEEARQRVGDTAESGERVDDAGRATDIDVVDGAVACSRVSTLEGCGSEEVQHVLQRLSNQARVDCRVLVADETAGQRGVGERGLRGARLQDERRVLIGRHQQDAATIDDVRGIVCR